MIGPQKVKKGIKHTANTTGGTGGKTWRRLKQITIVVFVNLLFVTFYIVLGM